MPDLSSLFLQIPFGFLLALLVFVVYWVNVFLVIYHLTRFGIGVRPKVIALVFFMGAIVLFAVAAGLAYRVNLAAILTTLNAQTEEFLPLR